MAKRTYVLSDDDRKLLLKALYNFPMGNRLDTLRANRLFTFIDRSAAVEIVEVEATVDERQADLPWRS
jgi:hypothetical protein